MSDQDTITEYGTTKEGYNPKDVVTMRNDGIQALEESRAVGTDIATTPEEPLVQFTENALTEPARIDAQLNLAVLQRDPTTASGVQLAEYADGYGLDGRKPASPASANIRFDRTGKVGTTVPKDAKTNNGLTGNSKITYVTQEEIEMPAVFEFTKGIGDDDTFSSAGDYANFLRFKEIVCISDTADRAAAETADYTETTDYTYTAYDDFLHWVSTGTNPATNTKYYIKFNDVSALVFSVSSNTGNSGNTDKNTITVVETPIPYITSSNNDEDINNGYNEETDENLRLRMKGASRRRINLQYVISQVNDVQGVRACTGVEDYDKLSAFKLTVDSTIYPMPQLIYDNILKRIEDSKSTASQPTVVLRLQRGTTVNGIDYFPAPFRKTWMVGRVNLASDFSGTAYTRGTDFLYSENSGYIDWAPTGGSEPGSGVYFFLELIKAVKPATNVVIDMAILATLELNQDKDTVEQQLSNTISAYMNDRSFGEDVFFYEITRLINENTSIGVIQDLKFTAKFKLTKHATHNEDLLPLEGLAQLLTVSLNEDLSNPKIYLTHYKMDSDVMAVQYTGSATATVLSISNKKFRTYEDGVLTVNEDLEDRTIGDLVSTVNGLANYTATASTDNSVSAKYLEDVEGIDIKSSSVNLRGNNMIFWVSSPPPANTEYWTDADFRGSFFLRDDEIARLGDLTLTEA